MRQTSPTRTRSSPSLPAAAPTRRAATPRAGLRAASVLPAAAMLAATAVVLVGCAAGPAPPTPPIAPGTATSPREVNVILKDYQYIPDGLDLVPGETVLFHFVNGGLAVHEAIIGDMATQEAWEEAEALHADPPPGPTPVVTVPVGMEGFRVVVESGERKDVRWTVPTEVASPLILGCHIPGHWARGMQAPIRLVVAGQGPVTVTSTPSPQAAGTPAPTATASSPEVP